VGVVIPTYNRGSQVVDAVEGALAQRDVDVEVVVVDDGSTDDTRQRVEEALPRWGDRVRYVWTPNGERCRARNLGLRSVTAELVAFLDSDDVWEDDHLRRGIDALAAAPDAVASVADYGLVSPELDVLVEQVDRPRVDDDRLLALLCTKQLIIHPSEVLIRRRFLAEDPFDPDVPGAEDWLLWLALAAQGPFTPTGARTIWMRVNLDGTFADPTKFGASIVLAGEKVATGGLPERAGVDRRDVRAVCRMNASYAYVLNGRHLRGLGLQLGAAAVQPAVLRRRSWWLALGRALVPAVVARRVRARRRRPLRPLR
jgi:glycosyltransferase involved in cell wall biosynthesis